VCALLANAAFDAISFAACCVAGLHKDLPRGGTAAPKVDAAGT